MKSPTLLPLLLFTAASLTAFTQTSKKDPSLLGAWIEKTDSTEEIKLISPTHVFFFNRNPKTDSFNVAGAGTYTLSGNQYTEHLQYASFDIKGIQATYNYSVQGNHMKQWGTLVLGDSAHTQIPINHTFTRIEGTSQNSGKQIGTWKLVSSAADSASGNQAQNHAERVRYMIITPTHWMRIATTDGGFERAFGGTYKKEGDHYIFSIDFASIPITGTTAELTNRFEGNRMIAHGMTKGKTGTKGDEINDVYERAEAP